VNELFKPEVRVIAEPGRYFATECTTLAVSVIGKRCREIHHDDGNPDEKIIQYYLSDGIYGSFNNIIFDHFEPNPHIVHHHNDVSSSHLMPIDQKESALEECTLFGPTCDSIDVISKHIKLPPLQIGDWLYFTNMGAYTMASASSFNGFKTPTPIYIIH